MKILRLGSVGLLPCFTLSAIAFCFCGCAHFPPSTPVYVPRVEEQSPVAAPPLIEKLEPKRTQPVPEAISPAEEWHAFGSISLTTAALLTLIAIGVLVPASVPIVGRIFALLVTRLPGLAGISGVVGVDAFDAIVKAIERSKQRIHFANEPAFHDLHAELSRELDTAHKRLVRARKETFAREGNV